MLKQFALFILSASAQNRTDIFVPASNKELYLPQILVNQRIQISGTEKPYIQTSHQTLNQKQSSLHGYVAIFLRAQEEHKVLV